LLYANNVTQAGQWCRYAKRTLSRTASDVKRAPKKIWTAGSRWSHRARFQVKNLQHAAKNGGGPQPKVHNAVGPRPAVDRRRRAEECLPAINR